MRPEAKRPEGFSKPFGSRWLEPTYYVSKAVTYITPLVPPPEPPTNAILGSDGLTLTGTAAAGASIRVYDAAGNLIGSGSANIGTGSFSITLNAAQLNGQHISVTAVSLLGGESQPVFLQAADITPPANPVVFASSFLGQIAAVQQASSLFALPPEWNQTPENAFATGQLLYDHLESPRIQHRHEFVIGDSDQELFPASVPAATFPSRRFLNALHGATEAQNFRCAG